MNRERAAEIWPIAKAFAEGKDVQFMKPSESADTSWLDCKAGYWLDWECPEPPFLDPDFMWRIKPEPREFTLYVAGNTATTYCSPGRDEIIKVREVIDD